VSREFKYGIEGLLLAIAFFVAVKILFFFISVSSQQQLEISAATTEIIGSSKSSTSFPEGKTLFSANCTSCHAVNKIILGPALAVLQIGCLIENYCMNGSKTTRKF
jgi:hypothetical protein